MDQGAIAVKREVPDVDETIGTNLRRFRHERGITGGDLGAQIGVSAQQINKYENGTDRIAAARLFAAAIALQVPIELFYDGLDGIVAEIETRDLDLIHRAAGELAKIPEPFRGQLIGIIQAMRRAADDIAAALLRCA